MTKPVVVYLVTEAWYFLAHHLLTAQEAVRRGYRVIVATNIGDREDDLRATGLELAPIPFRRAGLSPVHEWRTIRSIEALYRRVEPAVVHHIALKPILLGTLAARRVGIRRIVNMVTGLGFVFASDRILARSIRLVLVPVLRAVLAGQSLVLIVQNRDDAETLIRLRIAPPERVVVIRGLGVDLGRFRQAPLPEGTPIVVLPARLLWDKGIGEFVAAAQLLRNRGARASFALVGAQDDQNPSAVPPDVLRRWQDDGAVELWGYRPDIENVYRDASVVCLPSYREGLPQSLLEAAAVGRPIVATDAPGCREVVRDGWNGRLVPVRDAEALAAALADLLDAPDLRVEMGRCGRELVEREFTIERALDDIFAQYADGRSAT